MSIFDHIARLWKKPSPVAKFAPQAGRQSFAGPKKDSYHLSLSGGGLRGFAHIGVYKALVEYGYTIASVEGTSIGALVGLFIAAKKTPKEIEEIFINKSFYKLLPISFSGDGVFSLKKITQLVEEVLEYPTLESLPLPLTVCVTDFVQGKALYCSQGEIKKLIIASCAIPGVFDAIEYDNTLLVDGSVFDNMPITASQGLPIIACHVNPRIFDPLHPTKDIATNAVEMMMARDITSQSQQCDIFFEPQELTKIGFGFSTDRQEIIDIGYRHAVSFLSSSIQHHKKQQ